MKILSKAILVLLISILSSASFAVLFTITSTFSIQGTAPYFTFNGKKLQQSEQLFSFSFKDTNNEVITKDGVESNSSETNPVELDLGIKKLNDITLVMPNNTAPNSAGDYEYELSEYIKDKNNFNDDDGDDKEGAKAEGKLTLTIKDRFGNKVKYEDYYDSCLAPYSFSFFLTDSKLSTKYGAPNTRDYPKASKTNYFINKNQDVKSCYVQPKSTTVLEFNGEKGIRSDWQADKTGFKIVSDADLNLNFPKTGFDNAQFTIALPVGANFDNLTFTKNGDANITLDLTKINLSEKQQSALVTIKGANKANPQTFTPTTFTINADGKNLYSFKLNKWFILDADSKGSIKDAMSYCFDLPDYRLINLHDITNGHLLDDAKGALLDAIPAWSKDGFARAIGDGTSTFVNKGSLTAEWGDITSYGYANGWMATSTQRSENLDSYISVNLTKGEQTTHTLNATVVAKACVSDGENLFAVKLPDGMVYHRGNNPSSKQTPIELQEGKTFADVNIKDGVSITITDANGMAVQRSQALTACDSPYKLSLSKDGVSVDYYFKPAGAQVCYAQPNLEKPDGTGIVADDFIEGKGFKLKDVSVPSKNFPRTGFDYAFFNLVLEGTTAQDIITAMGGEAVNPETGTGVKLSLEQGKNVNFLRITLNGPNKATNGGTFTPSTFKIKTTNNKVIYSFEVSKWFVATDIGTYGDNQTYCQNLNGNYRMPSVSEYINGNSSLWAYGTPGVNNDYGMYSRAIGNGKRQIKQSGDDGVGGLFAEWGYTANSKYSSSGFVDKGYFGFESNRSSRLGYVESSDGYIFTYSSFANAACVSDGKSYLSIIAPTTSIEESFDKDGEYFDIENNPSTAQSPIELQKGKTFNDVKIKDGVSITITDANGMAVQRSQALTACDAPYKLSLSKDGASVDYYFKSPGVQACYAQSDFDKKNSNDTTIGNGYKIVNAESVEANFPTTGFNNANFRLSLAGITNENATIVKDFGADSVTASLFKDSDNVVGIILDGPTHANQKEFKPTQFTVYGDAAKTIKLYSFKLTKWFISSPNGMRLSDAQNYCLGLPNYRLADARELTNATAHGEAVVEGWTENKFKRAIGGGLFAEWNDAGAYDSSKNNFVQYGIYWSSSYFANSINHFADIKSSEGWIGNASDNLNDYKWDYQRAACVSDGNVVNKPKVSYARTYVSMDNSSNSWEWVQDKGFKVVNNDHPSSNFPRTGFNNAHFYLDLENTITAGAHIVKDWGGDNINAGTWIQHKHILGVWLGGPRDNVKNEFKPTQFTVYADAARAHKLYSFRITKWFVAAPDNKNLLESQEYCESMPNYRLARVDELTNASRSDYGIVGSVGTAKINWDNDYFNRAIGDGGTDTGWRGSLTAEWGVLHRYESHSNKDSDPNVRTNFKSRWIYTSDNHGNEDSQIFVGDTGQIEKGNIWWKDHHSVICVSDGNEVKKPALITVKAGNRDDRQHHVRTQNYNDYNQNFPWTGFNGAYFTIYYEGAPQGLKWPDVWAGDVHLVPSDQQENRVTYTMNGELNSNQTTFEVIPTVNNMKIFNLRYGFKPWGWFGVEKNKLDFWDMVYDMHANTPISGLSSGQIVQAKRKYICRRLNRIMPKADQLKHLPDEWGRLSHYSHFKDASWEMYTGDFYYSYYSNSRRVDKDETSIEVINLDGFKWTAAEGKIFNSYSNPLSWAQTLLCQAKY